MDEATVPMEEEQGDDHDVDDGPDINDGYMRACGRHRQPSRWRRRRPTIRNGGFSVPGVRSGVPWRTSSK